MKVYLDSIGCRLNQSEIETMAGQLLANGHEIVMDPAAADTVIINTCAVTREAAKDARNRTRRINRQNEGAQIWLTGCYATIAPAELKRLPGASRVIPNQEKDRLIQILDPQADIDRPVFDREPLTRELISRVGRTRAFVKVQDGCDNRCTFCLTTIARGAGRSRPLGDVVAEIQTLAAAGYQEAILSGVHLGSYGRDLGQSTGLRDLVRAILDHTDIGRLRLSSLEPWDIAPGFFELWANPRLLPHLHVPLQSGSDAVLRRMARRTTRTSFRELAAAARAAIPDLSLSTDLIAGFPGESDSDFQATVDFVCELRFSRLHVFAYSRRPGTAAMALDGHLPQQVKKKRTQQLIDLGHELSLAFHQRYEGQTRDVLWESAVGANDSGTRWVGYTDNYIRVTALGPADIANRVIPAHLLSARSDGLLGSIQQTS